MVLWPRSKQQTGGMVLPVTPYVGVVERSIRILQEHIDRGDAMWPPRQSQSPGPVAGPSPLPRQGHSQALSQGHLQVHGHSQVHAFASTSTWGCSSQAV